MFFVGEIYLPNHIFPFERCKKGIFISGVLFTILSFRLHFKLNEETFISDPLYYFFLDLFPIRIIYFCKKDGKLNIALINSIDHVRGVLVILYSL